MIFKNPEPKNLAEWLEIATKGIAAAGKERITREIGVHYAEAVEAHVNRGETEEAAKVNALGELGDAKKARRKFRKRHLTKWQENWLEEFQHEAGSKLGLAIFLLLGFAVEITFIKKWHATDKVLVCLLIFVIFLVLPTVTFWRLRQPQNKSNLTSISMIALIQFALTFGVMALVACIGSEDFVFFCCQPAWILLSIQSFRAWKKIRTHENPAVGT